MARALADVGHSVHVLAPYDPDLVPLDEGGVEVHRFRYVWPDRLCLAGHARSLRGDERLKPLVPLLMPGYVAAALVQALSLHRRIQFDVIHGHWAVPSGFVAGLLAQLTGVPLVVSLHGGGDVCLMQGSALYRAAGRYGFSRAARVTVCSHDMLRAAQEMGLQDGMVIPYGVDTARFACGRGDEMRRRLGLPADALVVGALGRLTGIKGFQHLVAAAPYVLERASRAYLVIGGSGELEESLRAQADALRIGSRLLFPGHVPWQDTPDFYAMCDVLAVPSVTSENGNVDGLPNVLLEAMASGACVVASRVAGIPDVIRDGVNGALVPPANPMDLAERLVALLEDASLRESMGANARETMLDGRDWRETAEVLERLYRDALVIGAAEPRLAHE
jgi:glycosyltransferase involved in cell wall biosynthesis